MAVHPDPRRLHDFPPLGTGHCLEWTPKCCAPPSLDLNKGDQTTAPSDQVQFDAADAKPVRDDFPASRLEVPDRLFLPVETPLVPRVRPIRWIAMNAARHAQEPSIRSCPDITGSVR